MKQVTAYKVNSLTNLKPDSIVALRVPNQSKFDLYITDLQGVPYSLNVSVPTSAVTSINNTDGNLEIAGSSTVVINVSPSLLSTINSALQPGANISELVNDAGFITTETDPIFQASEASLFVAGDKVNLDNQSGINTGDETTLSIQTKRPLKTVNGESLEGSGNIVVGSSVTKTSDLINDGEDNTSTYVETDELGAVAFSNDYNDLDNLPPTSTSSTLIREEFVFSGSQTFTLANNYAQIYSVEVQGQGALSTSQYTLVSPNQVTINDNLDSGDYVVIIYSDETLGVIPYYTQAQTDLGFISTVPNFVYVRDVNDFPSAISGVRTLLPEVTYFIADIIDLNGDRLVGGANTTILGASSENSILTSTGLGVGVPLLSSIYTTPIRHISINDVDTAISFDGATNPNEMALDWTGVNFVNVPNVGLIKDAVNFIFDKGAFLNSKGLLFDGTIDTIGFGNCLFSGDGLVGNIIEVADTCIINRRFRIIYSSIVAFALTKGIKVGASAGISEESYILDTINFSGGGTYLDGTNHISEKSLFVNCVGIINTESLGSMYMKNNATATVITVQGDRYNIAGTTQVNGINQRFEHDLANNALQYTGIRSKVFHVNLTFTLNPASNNQKYGIYIGVNKGGAIDPTADRISESEAYINTPQAGRADAAAIQALVQLDPNDRVYMIVQNTTSTANVTVESMNLVIK
jgi:hypothetical protein